MTPPRGVDSSDDLDARLVARLPSPKEFRRVAPTVLRAVHLLVALVAHEHQILDAVELSGIDSLVSPRAITAERPDVSSLGDVDLLLRDGGLPQGLVAACELAATGRAPPKQVAEARGVSFMEMPLELRTGSGRPFA